MNFNVESFKSVVDNIIDKCDHAEACMEKIFSNIDDIKVCIGSQESPTLYQGWGDLKTVLESVKNKYLTRKEEFIAELNNYKEQVILNNDYVYKIVNSAKNNLDTIAGQIDSL